MQLKASKASKIVICDNNALNSALLHRTIVFQSIKPIDSIGFIRFFDKKNPFIFVIMIRWYSIPNNCYTNGD